MKQDWQNSVGLGTVEDMTKATCTWTEDAVNGFWDTACGEAFCTSTDEPPSKHDMRHCPYCGRRIEERRPVMANFYELIKEHLRNQPYSAECIHCGKTLKTVTEVDSQGDVHCRVEPHDCLEVEEK